MPAQLLAFPGKARTAPPPPDAPDLPRLRHSRPFVPATREYDINAVARLVGLAHVSQKVLIGTLRKLAEQSGMPLPKTPRIHAGIVQSGALSIGKRSRWDAMRFDDWLDGWTPPGGAAAYPGALVPETASAATRDAMASRAVLLGQLGRRRA
ncbi:hypothetical protein [Novosphingobium huizhouense]|uniref:hypothetical protein n=1 Tax=Novosphingobium huizhouense TaxID=2866625 RepID=UPI001CD884A1|nr:hypothetical protein [Novosphingobium huizhouense]